MQSNCSRMRTLVDYVGKGGLDVKVRTGLLHLALAGLVTVGVGCAASIPPPPPRPAFVENPALHPLYGGQGYLKAVGMSTVSQAEAELAAKTNVAAQVRSSLKAVTTVRKQEIQQRGSEAILNEYGTLITAETGFDRAEFIRIDPAAVWKEGSAFYAFAYLDRGALLAALEPEYKQEAAVFSALAQHADEAYESGDPRRFLENCQAARKSFSALEEKARVLFVARDGPYGPHEEQERVFMGLVERKVALKNGLQFLVSFRGPESQLGRERLQAIFQRFFERAGLNAVLCNSCPCEGGLHFRFVVEAREVFKEGVLGPICTLALAARVTICQGEQTVVSLNMSSPALKGAHTSDKGIALSKLYGNFPEESTYKIFKANMLGYFPVMED